jgi:hypothetical protein
MDRGVFPILAVTVFCILGAIFTWRSHFISESTKNYVRSQVICS